jgi:hypothetical protein
MPGMQHAQAGGGAGMTWQQTAIAKDGTHHLIHGAPAYPARFDQVLAFHAPGLAPVSIDQEAWHIYPDGNAAYTNRFRRTFGFYEGLAAVISDRGWLHINPDGTDAYSERFDWCGNFQCGRCTVRQDDGHYFHIRPDGKPAYSQRWRYAGDFRDGLAVVQSDNGRSTHIDSTGQLLHECWFFDLDVFHKGYARARDEAGWMHIDASGRPTYRRRFASVEPFYNGLARVERFDGGLEIIDESGAIAVELRPALRSEFEALSGDMVGFWRTQTISAAVDLGLIEALPGSVETIAQACHLCPDRTQRLLWALAELSLVTEYENQWDLAERGRYLRADHPWTLSGAALEYGDYFPDMWKALPDAVRKHGNWRAPDIFGDLSGEESRCKGHHEMLRSYARHDYATVPEVMALRGDERIVDAGGGLGVLASALVAHYPDVSVMLLDRPEVIEHALSSGELSDRIDAHACNLFEPWCAEADVVVLARVLHDWNDNDASDILRHARAVLSPRGRLFIVEMVVSEDSAAGSLCDLHLLMATGGQERTLAEYKGLMDRSGFAFTELRPLPALPSVIVGEAR